MINEDNSLAKTSGYTYIYDFVENVYDSSSDPTTKILIGKYLQWAQRSSVTLSTAISFTLKGSYKAITGESTYSHYVSESYTFDNSYDNALGLLLAFQHQTHLIRRRL